MPEGYDYGEDSMQTPEVTASGFDELDTLIADLTAAELEVQRLEEQLKLAKLKLANISEIATPRRWSRWG